MERNVLEYVDHLHEWSEYPCSINENGRYNIPSNPEEGYSIKFTEAALDKFTFPHGSYWSSEEAKRAHGNSKYAPGGVRASSKKV